ncbi:MAG: hypothetical protein WCA07_09575 [Gloeobacterales cyanobacterium]
MSAYRNAQWDLAIYSRDGQLVLVAEIKSKLNASPEWAAQLRRNILAHGTFPKAPYFLMAFPDRFYLWTDADIRLDQSEPTYVIDARPILQPYFKQAGVAAEQISAQSLELIVASWLGEIIHLDKSPTDIDESQRWLIESGLYAAIFRGRFAHEAVA